MTYEDFVIQLGPTTAHGLLVRVSCPSGGDETGTLDFPIDPDRIRRGFPTAVQWSAGRHIEPIQGSGSPALEPAEIGHALFQALFRTGVRSVFDRSLGSVASQPHRGLRIKLKIDLRDASQAALHDLPWELLFRSDTSAFLGLSRHSPIVRYLDVPREIRSRPLPDRLRVLVLAPETSDLPPIDLRSERRNLEIVERRVKGLEIEFLASADLGTLRSALLDRETHVLHYMGHGDHDPQTGEGVLYLNRGNGRSEAVSARDFVHTIQDFPDLKLVVLNACNTGCRGSETSGNPFAGVAPGLMQAGIPAVLAMQLPISDDAAIAFSEAFYRRLGAGDPVDAAATEGRLAISRMDRRTAEWAVPALFMRVPHGSLFSSPRPAKPEGAVGRGGSDDIRRPQATWRAHIEVGNHDAARDELRQELALDPTEGLSAVGMAIALTRGVDLRTLDYRNAKEIHRLLAGALSRPEGKGLAAAFLIALKLDYFRTNAVREANPHLDEVVRIAATSAMTEEDRQLLDLLEISQRTREILSRVLTRKGRAQ